MSWTAKTRHDREVLQPFHDQIKDVVGRLHHQILFTMTKAQVRTEEKKAKDDPTSIINRLHAIRDELNE